MRRLLHLAIVAVASPASAQFSAPPACMDGVDNDDDGKTDYSLTPGAEDPGCDAWNDTSEEDLTFSPVIRPRLAVVFDTSTSMLWNVCTRDINGLGYTDGDGSSECPGEDVPCCNQPPGDPMQCTGPTGAVHDQCDSTTCSNAAPDDSRLFKVKVGVHDAIAAYGEIEYSLYRFHADALDWAGCPATATGSPSFGGWRGAPGDDCQPPDRLVKFSPENQAPLLQWLDQATNWDGAGDPPLGMDIELRGTGPTPLWLSLDRLKADLDAIRAADTDGACRPYRVVLVTDGQDSCPGGDPATSAAALRAAGVDVFVIGFAGDPGAFEDEMNDIAAAGGTGQAYFADDPASLSAALGDIVSRTVLVEKCDGMDNDCDGVIDNGFRKGTCNNGQRGACFRIGFFECFGPTETRCNAPVVEPPPEEPPECNGVDDDCDGIVDDGLTCAGCRSEICNGVDDDCDEEIDDGELPGVGEPCGISEGACEPGHFECIGGRLECVAATGPSPEVCDGIDNNCDGAIDGLIRQCYGFGAGCVDSDPTPGGTSFQCLGRCRAGTQTCTAATQPNFGECSGQIGPTAERCNGLDDDCDGRVDDGFEELGTGCMRGIGLCRATGKFVCSADGTQLVCDAPVVTGMPEVCNGVDDDCNSVIDDLPTPPPPPIGEPCGTCGGVYACRGGLVCEGGDASAEVCNGLDDDCNNIVDDGPLPEVGDSCVPLVDGQPAFMVVGECRAGRKECIEGELDCVGALGPQDEVCNGLDDDCDGTVDDMAACPAPTDTCYQAQCVSPCADGEFPCPFGFYCLALPPTNGRFCVPDPCAGVTCDPGEICNRDTGTCVDPCAGVTCTDGRVCRAGQCVDCFTLGCPAGMICVENAARVGECQADACLGIECPTGQTCAGGSCAPVACAGGCAPGSRCQDDACVPSCSLDLCFGGSSCPAGTVCNPRNGRCLPDPCARTDCGGLECAISCEGRATCAARPAVNVVATGGGGFQCEIGAVSRGSARTLLPLVVLLPFLLVLRRKR
jgi:hypothetical protein